MTRKFMPGEVVLCETPTVDRPWEGEVVEQLGNTYVVRRFSNQFVYTVFANEMM